MSTYAIGDVHGCLQPLLALLHAIDYQPSKDTLWFTGDLINRGPQSLQTLEFVMSLPKSTVVVLGNHDLSLLIAHAGLRTLSTQPTFVDILASKHVETYIEWFRQCPLLYHDRTLGFTITHAGILPAWDLATAQTLAREIESYLQGDRYLPFLENLAGNHPTEWSVTLSGWDRARFIVNAFTRMRYCTKAGHLDWTKSPPSQNNNSNIQPWFSAPQRAMAADKILFGHWAALEGQCDTANVYALDTGCVWGKYLTALCLETGQRFFVPNLTPT